MYQRKRETIQTTNWSLYDDITRLFRSRALPQRYADVVYLLFKSDRYRLGVEAFICSVAQSVLVRCLVARIRTYLADVGLSSVVNCFSSTDRPTLVWLDVAAAVDLSRRYTQYSHCMHCQMNCRRALAFTTANGSLPFTSLSYRQRVEASILPDLYFLQIVHTRYTTFRGNDLYPSLTLDVFRNWQAGGRGGPIYGDHTVQGTIFMKKM